MGSILDGLTPAQREHFLNGPALAPPPGVVPVFGIVPDASRWCIGFAIASIVISAIAALVRLYTKIVCLKRLRVEDYIALAGFAFYAGLVYVMCSSFSFPGPFVHQWNMRMAVLPQMLKTVNHATIVYGLAMALLKISILLDWIHIFAPSSAIRGTFYWACVGNIIINALFYFSSIVAGIFACTPRSKIENFFEHGTCINTPALFLAASIFNLIMDLVMLGMPQKVIWELTLPIRKKMAISVVFAFGIMACVCGALRVVYCVPYLQSPDKTHHVSAMGLAGLAELAAGWLVLCMPSLPKFAKSIPFLARLFSNRTPEENSRLGLPSWIRAQGQRHASRPQPLDTECSEDAVHAAGGELNLARSSVSGSSESRKGTSGACSPEIEFITTHEV